MASAEHYNWNGELRVAKDGQPYSLSQFMQHYGKNWEQHWEEAARISQAEQQRIQLLGQQLHLSLLAYQGWSPLRELSNSTVLIYVI